MSSDAMWYEPGTKDQIKRQQLLLFQQSFQGSSRYEASEWFQIEVEKFIFLFIC